MDAGWVDLVGWLHTEVVYLPEDAYLSILALTMLDLKNLIHAMNDVTTTSQEM